MSCDADCPVCSRARETLLQLCRASEVDDEDAITAAQRRTSMRLIEMGPSAVASAPGASRRRPLLTYSDED